jgi:hypothetical protein
MNAISLLNWILFLPLGAAAFSAFFLVVRAQWQLGFQLLPPL